MYWYPSWHVFTNQPKRMIENYLKEVTNTDEAKYRLINKLFDIYQRKNKYPDEQGPTHYMKLAEQIMALNTVFNDGNEILDRLSEMGNHLNIYGDIIYSRDVVHILDPRLLSCTTSTYKDVIYYDIQRASAIYRRVMVSHDVIKRDDDTSECRIYFGERGKVCGIKRCSDVSENEEWDMHNLPKMFNKEEIERLNFLLDPVEFSKEFCKTFCLVTDGTGYKEFLEEKCRFIKNDRLHDIYEIIDDT